MIVMSKRGGKGTIHSFFNKSRGNPGLNTPTSSIDEENVQPVQVDEETGTNNDALLLLDSPSEEVPPPPIVPTTTVVPQSTSSSSSAAAATNEVEIVASRSFVGDVSSTTTRTRADGLNNQSPMQPRLSQFPPTNGRSFSNNWYKGRPWLEYSTKNDAAYCFPCRVFGVNSISTIFTEEGFTDWKHALEGWNFLDTLQKTPENAKKLKGFAKHVTSASHVRNLSAWRDKENREKLGKTLESVACKLDSDNRKWIEIIFIVIRYLAADGLPFRGDVESLDFEKGLSGGLFLNTLQNLVFVLQPELAALGKKMPRNAKYLSSDIQNEFIEVMADMVREIHAAKVKSSELFTIMVDGTTDKSTAEVEGIVVRFFCMDTEEMEEKALNIGESGRAAEEIFAFVRETLESCGISFDGLVSQTFDGASVMSGVRGGLQALVSQFCDRIIPYIHCYCHRLHLVVEDVMKTIPELAEFFSTVAGLYTFFKHAPVKEQYGGGTLKRLIDTRWSGHFVACKAVEENYDEIVQTLLLAAKNKKLDSKDRATAIGFHAQVVTDEFVFLCHFIRKILKACDIANKILQSSKENLASAMQSISSVRETLSETRDKYNDVKIRNIIETRKGVDSSRRSSRSTNLPSYLRDDSVITDIVPNRDDVNLRAVVAMTVDRMEEEFSRRFSSENTDVWSSMECLLPSASKESFLDSDSLEPLFDYAMTIPTIKSRMLSEALGKVDLRAECHVYRRVLGKELEKGSFKHATRNDIDMNKVCAYMIRHHAESAPVLTILYRVAVTAGYASARVECLFSALAMVDAPQWRRQSTKRESNLTFLYFERKTLMSLKIEDFIKIWESKPRKLSFN